MILMMGVAGAGKSVQGRLLADKLGYVWLSSGEFLRQHIIGRKRQDMLEGKLLGDQEIIAVFDETLSELGTKNHQILDGFPRTLPQAEWLYKQHQKKRVDIEAVILLKASKETVKSRLVKRGRLDDNEQAISKRFDEYEKMTLPIIAFYQSHGIPIYEINGERSVEAVNSEITQLVKKDIE